MPAVPDTAILGGLDPIANGINDWGWVLAQGAIEHRYVVGILLTAIIVPFAVGVRRGWGLGPRGWSPPDTSPQSPAPSPHLAYGFIAILAGVWGQVVLFSDLAVLGAALLVLACAGAIVFGASLPLRAAAPRCVPGLEIALVVALTAFALVVRAYAIDQLPAFVDIEPALAFFESLSGYGLAHYIAANRVEDDGFAHMLARYAVQSFTGPSVVGIRLAAAFSGTLAVPLCYAFVRRLTGIWPAFLAALALATAPEQLIFSRIEATQFSAIPSAALITAHLALWLARGWSPRAAIVTALWMPFSRYFYAPAIVLFLLPVGVVVHGVVCGPRRRRAAVALVIVLGGAALWFAASPALHWVATGHWREGSSLRVYGGSALRPFNADNAGIGADASVAAIMRFQIERFARNVGDLVKQFAYDRGAYSAWYLREHPDEFHRRSLHAALFIPFVAGLGYLLARWRDRRAALLVLWVFLGMLPAVLSDEVEPRRLVVLFPAVFVIVGVFVDALMRALSAGAPRFAGWPVRTALAVAAVYLAVTSIAANYRVYRSHLQYSEYVDFARPYFETSDAIFHNVPDMNTILIVAFGNATPFIERLPGFHFVRDWDAEWAKVTTDLACPFEHAVFETLRTKEAIEERCAAWRPARVTYLLRVETDEEHALARRIEAQFPNAEVREVRGNDRDDPIRHFVAYTVER